jgi:hypothetical protein
MPVMSDADHEQWRHWRLERKRQQQRERRASNRRIDYYPDAAAATLIYSMAAHQIGHDLSSVINRIVGEWVAAKRGRCLPPE